MFIVYCEGEVVFIGEWVYGIVFVFLLFDESVFVKWGFVSLLG